MRSASTRKNLDSLLSLGGGGEQGSASQSSMLYVKKRVCKPGSLVVKVIKNDDSSYAFLIDSGVL